VIINNNKDDDEDDEQKKEKKEGEKMSPEEVTNFLRKEFLGPIYYNLSYANGTIENSFKLNGKNYRKEIGEVNENRDYKSNNLNKYDLYIPYSSLKTNKSKGIILFIHGGAWVQGDKEEMSYLAQIYFEHEYILANMDYTLLSEGLEDGSIYRLLDDISACIENIKYKLKNIGFNESELEVAIGGGSAGGIFLCYMVI
jgi:acetyl esterase/lipase